MIIATICPALCPALDGHSLSTPSCEVAVIISFLLLDIATQGGEVICPRSQPVRDWLVDGIPELSLPVLLLPLRHIASSTTLPSCS